MSFINRETAICTVFCFFLSSTVGCLFCWVGTCRWKIRMKSIEHLSLGIAAIRRRARGARSSSNSSNRARKKEQQQWKEKKIERKKYSSHTVKWSEWKIRTNEMENIVYIRPMWTGGRARKHIFPSTGDFQFCFGIIQKLCVCAFLYSSLRGRSCARCVSLVSCFVAHFHLHQKLNNKHTHTRVDGPRDWETERERER